MAEGFAPGDRVRVRQMHPPGHVRTPAYLRGRRGEVERALGAFANPERLAYGLSRVEVPLYRVRFSMSELWGDEAESAQDAVEVELYGHWLERAD